MSTLHNPLVSIAMCTYNGERHLEEQLDTICKQTYKNLEIVICDDKSTDSTYSLIKKYAEKDARIQLYPNRENVGFRKNFEKAISICTGEFIALADQDDIWSPIKIEKMLSLMDKDISLTYHDSNLISEEGHNLEKKMSDYFNFVNGRRNLSFLFHNCVSGHALMFRSSLKAFILPIPPIEFHDHWIAYVASTTGQICYSPLALVDYRQHPRNQTDVLQRRVGKSSSLSKRRNNIAGTFKRLKSQLLQIERLMHFYMCKANSQNDKRNISYFIDHYKNRHKIIFNFRLLIFFIKHFGEIWYISKISIYQKLRLTYKMCWGLKLKFAFYNLKNRMLII